MSNYHLFYAISNRTPVREKTLKAIQDVQTELNRRCTWTHERLSLAPAVEATRLSFTLPFPRFLATRPTSSAFGELLKQETPERPTTDSAASGSTKVRDNLWNAHLVVAFLRQMSTVEPGLLFELRDEGGFVLPGAVWIRAGKVELQRDWLNRERERVLEVTGDARAAMPFVWAETEALQGRFFLDAPASDYREVMEIQELDEHAGETESMSLGEAADLVVKCIAATELPVAA